MTIASSGNSTATLKKVYKDTNFTALISSNSTYYAQGEANNTCVIQSTSTLLISNGSHIQSVLRWQTAGYLA